MNLFCQHKTGFYSENKAYTYVLSTGVINDPLLIRRDGKINATMGRSGPHQRWNDHANPRFIGGRRITATPSNKK